MQLVYRWCKYAGLGAFMNNANIIALNLGLVSPSQHHVVSMGLVPRVIYAKNVALIY